jgi:2,4-diketo-3-deoxy-L-fuconate hydrolase
VDSDIIGGVVLRRAHPRPLGLVVGQHVTDLISAIEEFGYGIDLNLSIRELLARWHEFGPVVESALRRLSASDRETVSWEPISHFDLGAPVHPEASLIFTAANYAAHTSEAESSEKVTNKVSTGSDTPYVFLKPMRSVIGPCDDVVKPNDVEQLDWEVELAVVIGAPGRRIPVGKAMDHVAGYVICNDVSARDFVQRSDWPMFSSDWFAQKAFDTFTPIGPAFVPAGLVGDPRDLVLQLSVDGEVMQEAHARDMIFSIAEQISYASRFTSLEPGDIISTGTPSGVGMARGRYLDVGEVMTAQISGLGRQQNRIVQER